MSSLVDIATREGITRTAADALFLGAALACAVGPAADPARALLEESLDAMEAAREPPPAEGLLFEARGTLNQGVENQGRSPGSLDPSSFRETLAVDP
jgi:hypothetical protein